jgi:ribosome-associated toxin RatA of RatAB toxin-antitoxin module
VSCLRARWRGRAWSPGILPLAVLWALAGPLAADTGAVEVTLRALGRDRPQEGIARGLVAAPPERVFRAINDVEHWHEFMPFLAASDAQPQKDGSVLSAQRLDLPFPLGERHYRIRFRSRVERTPQGSIWRAEWSDVPGSGNLAGLRGSWTLTAAPEGTLATCRLWIDPGSPSSRLMDRATAKSLPWIFDGLRQHVRRSRYEGP